MIRLKQTRLSSRKRITEQISKERGCGMVSHPDTSDREDRWQPCPEGTISGMVRRLERQRRMAVTSKVAAGAGVLLVAVSIWFFSPGFGLLQSGDGRPHGGISCREVLQHRSAWVSGELARTDPELAEHIRIHLAQCPPCEKKYHIAPQVSFRANDHPVKRVDLSRMPLLALDR
jgi:hypothetical protein